MTGKLKIEIDCKPRWALILNNYTFLLVAPDDLRWALIPYNCRMLLLDSIWCCCAAVLVFYSVTPRS